MIGMIERRELTELLGGPLRRGMRGHIRVKNPPRTDLHCNEDVQDAERSGHGNEEVAGNNGIRMIPHKVGPALVRGAAARPK